MSNSNEVNWPPAIWDSINDAIRKEMGKVRIAQRVFPTVVYDTNPTEVSNDVINFRDSDGLSITEGQTKPYAEISCIIGMTSPQLAREAETKTGLTLARMAAKALALAEDTIFFQGNTKLPSNVKADRLQYAAKGLLGEASPEVEKDTGQSKETKDEENEVTKPIDVRPLDCSETDAIWGEHVFSAVARGIAMLTSKAQAKKYALFLPTKVYADTHVPPSNASLVTTAECIKPLVEGGFYGTGTLPHDKGLLVALGGDPTCLYVGRDATMEFVKQEGSKYFFRVVERIQFVARDPRAFVLLNFQQPVKKERKASRDPSAKELTALPK